MGVDKLLLRKILMLCSALGRFKIYSHKEQKSLPRLHSQTSPAKNDSPNRFLNAVVRFGSTPTNIKNTVPKKGRYFLVPVMGVDKLLLRKILMLCSALGRFKIYSHKEQKSLPRLHSQTSPAKNDSPNRFLNAVVRFGSTPTNIKKYRL